MTWWLFAESKVNQNRINLKTKLRLFQAIQPIVLSLKKLYWTSLNPMPPYLHLRLPYHQRWKGQILPENKVSCESFGMDRKTLRLVNIRDQVRACDLIFESNKKWTIVPGSDFEVGVIQGMPFWCELVGDPILESNLTRRIDFALFMVVAHKNDNLIHKVPAIVRCNTESATAYK